MQGFTAKYRQALFGRCFLCNAVNVLFGEEAGCCPQEDFCGVRAEFCSAGFAPVPGFQPSLPAVTEAQKSAKFAVSSLGFEDVDNAVKYLNQALKLLTSPSGK